MNKEDDLWKETLHIAKQSGFHIDAENNIHTMLIDKYSINEEVEAFMTFTVEITQKKQCQKLMNAINELAKFAGSDVVIHRTLNRVTKEIEKLCDERN